MRMGLDRVLSGNGHEAILDDVGAICFESARDSMVTVRSAGRMNSEACGITVKGS